MSDNYFDQLPDEIKYQILYLLPITDLHSLLLVNRLNAAILQSRDFWYYCGKRDFYSGIDEIVSRQTHLLFGRKYNFEYLPRLDVERKFVVSYIAACRFIVRADVCEIDNSMEIVLLDTLIEHTGMEAFWRAMNTETYGYAKNNHVDNPASELNVLFKTMIMSTSHDTRVCAYDLLREPKFECDNPMKFNYIQSLSFVLCAMAKCNAYISLRIFFQKIRVKQRVELMEKIGAELLCAAAEFANVEATQELLKAGANPNRYSLLDSNMDSNFMMLPVVSLCRLIFKRNRMNTRGEAIAKILDLFLAAGLNVDLKVETVNVATIKITNHLQTVREWVKSSLLRIESHSDLHTKENMLMISEILHRIISAPSYCELAESQTDNRSDCERSTHTSPQPQHRRQP